MDYVNICTTVFTPIEYSCRTLRGRRNCTIRRGWNRGLPPRIPPSRVVSFPGKTRLQPFTKIIVEKKSGDEKVLGMHYVGPNAGEVMQGYGVSMRTGVTYKQLTETVGIHPTSSEEIVTLSITKSSGEDAAA